jgi:hypothetical protein
MAHLRCAPFCPRRADFACIRNRVDGTAWGKAESKFALHHCVRNATLCIFRKAAPVFAGPYLFRHLPVIAAFLRSASIRGGSLIERPHIEDCPMTIPLTIRKRLPIVMLSALAGTALTAVLPDYAAAQDAQTERLQRQIDSLQRQLQAVQREMSDAKKAQADQAAAQKKAAAEAARQAVADAYGKAGPGPTKAPGFLPPGVKLSWGGFIEAAGVYRTRNEVADIGSDFNNIPYPISPLYHENEMRFSARQSRLWFGAEGDISPSQIVRAYFEMDFLGAATTANSIESNSYTPRIRQAFVSWDDMATGWHVLGGQAWSLVTQNKNGIVARQENTPLVIDAQTVVGFNWTRVPQFRLVKDFGPAVSVGVSAETPQVRFQTPGSASPPGVTILSVETGTQSGNMDTLQSYSIDHIPDFVEKVAFDPGWGHYEVLGLQRWFTDRTCIPAVGSNGLCIGTANNNTTFGWGVGGSVLLPAVPKYLDLQGSILYGQGIGRYGAGQLPDVTFDAQGKLSPVTALQAMVGAVGHVTPDLDVYVYAGLERDDANFGSIGTSNFGFGNPLYSDAFCFTENFTTPAAPTSPVTGVLSNTGCSVNVKQLAEITVGAWYNFYKGEYGRLAGGLQYEYIHRDTFQGLAAATLASGFVTPSTDESVFLTSLRYYFP